MEKNALHIQETGTTIFMGSGLSHQGTRLLHLQQYGHEFLSESCLSRHETATNIPVHPNRTALREQAIALVSVAPPIDPEYS